MDITQNGLIPYFIVGGYNPCCFSRFVLEFKGVDQQMLSESNDSLYLISDVNMMVS
jgi:hypothetical protein